MTQTKERYQVLPPLGAAEEAALRESISTFGILQPVIVDEKGVTIDGHHRRRIAGELGIECPTMVLGGLSEVQKVEQALVLNLARRNLTPAPRDALVADLRARGLSIRTIAGATGIPKSTVARATVPFGTVPEYIGGLNGKQYRAQTGRTADAEMQLVYNLVNEVLSRGYPDGEPPLLSLFTKWQVLQDQYDRGWPTRADRTYQGWLKMNAEIEKAIATWGTVRAAFKLLLDRPGIFWAAEMKAHGLDPEAVSKTKGEQKAREAALARRPELERQLTEIATLILPMVNRAGRTMQLWQGRVRAHLAATYRPDADDAP